MIKQLIRDESGMAMGLAIITMVLIGVMGAGLLVFVRNDLEAVVEVNQGQQAFDIADAGAQVAKQQLLGDKEPGHYDVEGATLCNTDDRDPDDIDTTDDIPRTPSSENWAPGAGGQTRTFANGQFTVTIQWMNPDPTSPANCIAPETGTPPPGTDYFKVISTGKYRNATRRIEAIYETYDLHVPRAYYTPGKITLSGTAKISKVSLFTSSDIEVQGGAEVTGEDLAYKAWAAPSFPNTFNSTARSTTNAGLGAAGRITYTGGATSQLGTRDFDSDPANARPGPDFVQTPSAPQLPEEITFPFNLANQPDADRLCDEAKAQDNYVTDDTPSTSTDFPNAKTDEKFTDWPSSSSNQTVVCYEFTNLGNSHTLRWTVPGNETLAAPYDDCKGPIRKGTLVIKNGGFSIKSGNNVALFRGVVVTRGPEALQDSEVGDAALTGNNCLDGFINSTGPIKIAGSVTPASSVEANDRPGFFGVRTWSWRELYE